MQTVNRNAPNFMMVCYRDEEMKSLHCDISYIVILFIHILNFIIIYFDIVGNRHNVHEQKTPQNPKETMLQFFEEDEKEYK